MAAFITQHHDTIGHFLTAVVIPGLFAGITLIAFGLDSGASQGAKKTN
jgi:hypothetical protein